ncbi:hypothetical protein P7C70_g2959, partial [Phenoliferia sp. Uapishka_3]
MKHWHAFVEVYRFDFVPSSYSLPRFTAFLSRRVKHPDKILSAMAAFFKPTMANWDEIRYSHAMSAVLTGAAKQPQRPTKRSPPLLTEHLFAFVEGAVAPTASYDDILFALISAVGFCGVMRLGDGLIDFDKIEDREWRKVIKRSSVVVTGHAEVKFVLPYSKTDKFYEGATIVLRRSSSPEEFSVVDLFKLYLKKRDKLFPSSDRLFIRSNGNAPSRDWVVKRIRLVAPDVSGHGLRAGGCTWLATRGVPSDVIKRLGRWKGPDWEIYIRQHPALMAALALWALKDHPELE